MSATGLEVFDKTIHTTNTWLGEVMEKLGPDRQVAWHVLGAVLRAVRDRIPFGPCRPSRSAAASSRPRYVLRSVAA